MAVACFVGVLHAAAAYEKSGSNDLLSWFLDWVSEKIPAHTIGGRRRELFRFYSLTPHFSKDGTAYPASTVCQKYSCIYFRGLPAPFPEYFQ